jgi:hypothetical protein
MARLAEAGHDECNREFFRLARYLVTHHPNSAIGVARPPNGATDRLGSGSTAAAECE